MRRSGLIGVVLALATSPLPAQRSQGGAFDYHRLNTPYDGRFTFVRIMYTPAVGGRWPGREPEWAHDYPRAERNFTKILNEITYIAPYMEGYAGNVLPLSDPDLFKYPIAYMSEPGFWTLTADDAEHLRNYLLKGGFVIFDDFADNFRGGRQWANFVGRMRVVLPEHHPIPMDVSHPIFNSFFQIEKIDYPHPYFGVIAEYYGFFEDNDPTKRLVAIANYNNDIGEYWEFSDTGFLPIDLSNEAYKIGVNYIVYAMTH